MSSKKKFRIIVLALYIVLKFGLYIWVDDMHINPIISALISGILVMIFLYSYFDTK